ncbi:MAG TPA: aldo/keto reductase [Bryobacteraceae bacterium]
MTQGHATVEGTARYAKRFIPHFSDFFTNPQGMTASSLGIGSYLGNADEATSRAYDEAVTVALDGGVNFIDTSLNYRHQLSERNIGSAVERLIEAGRIARDEFWVSTKAGYLVPGAVSFGVLGKEDVVNDSHSISPRFLSDQLDRSRRNLGLGTIDIFYLHNPETQLEELGEDEFYGRVEAAFAMLEEAVSDGKISFYGAATWDGFRMKDGGGLSLRRMERIARSIAGELHKFRFIQLPFNLAMPEALQLRDDAGRSVLEHAVDLDISVVASASLLQSRLAQGLPEVLHDRLKGLSTDAQRAIQFARSTPGIDVALVGMSKTVHVAENLGVAHVPPVELAEYLQLFRQ